MHATRIPTLHPWVEAAPFRAHLLHVAESTGIPWPVIAVQAGMPQSLAARLLFGTGRRRLPRLPEDCARRLLAVTPESARALRRKRTASSATTRRLHELRRRGWTLPELATMCDCSPAAVEALLCGTSRWVPLVLSHAVRAAMATADSQVAGRVLCAA